MTDLDQAIRRVLAGYDHDAAGQIDHLTGAIREVLDLHQPAWGLEHFNAMCGACAGDYPDGVDLRMPYPCPTVRAIAGHLIEVTS